jgi:hypothetical protein
LWLSWWDGIWLWIAAALVGGVIGVPLYLLRLMLPEPVPKVVAVVLGMLTVLAVPVVASRVFRALDNTKPWARNRP